MFFHKPAVSAGYVDGHAAMESNLDHSMFSRASSLGKSLFLLLAVVAGCVTVEVRTRTFSDPGEFARNLFRIAETGDARDWGTQLTEARRAQGATYIQRHFDFWQKNLRELKPAFAKPIDEVNFRVTEDNGLEFESDGKWNHLLRVTREDGALKINQD
jgi:hypothetical protein